MLKLSSTREERRRVSEEDVDRLHLERQKKVNAYFHSSLDRWVSIYGEEGVYATIYQQRRRAALLFIDQLGLTSGTHVLEVGCAQGLTTTALAKDGLIVNAIDTVPEMVQATLQRSRTSEFAPRIAAQVADIHDLPFPDNAFKLVLVIGVTEWLHSLRRPLEEVARVLGPGGYLVIAADNKFSLANMIDPLSNPLIAPVKRIVRNLLQRFGILKEHIPTHSYSIQEFDSHLIAVGLKKLDGTTVGFGPFSFCRRALLSECLGLKVHHKLQSLADRNFPLLRSRGYVYVVLATKPVCWILSLIFDIVLDELNPAGQILTAIP